MFNTTPLVALFRGYLLHYSESAFLWTNYLLPVSFLQETTTNKSISIKGIAKLITYLLRHGSIIRLI